MRRSRRTVLTGMGAALTLGGCSTLRSDDAPGPPTIPWESEEGRNSVFFVHDGDEPIEIGDADFVVRRGIDEVKQVRFDLQEHHTSSVPDELEPGDSVVALGGDSRYFDLGRRPYFENGDRVRLRWVGPDELEWLAEHTVSEQPHWNPPDVDWETEETEDYIILRHGGGDELSISGDSSDSYLKLTRLDRGGYTSFYPDTFGPGDEIEITNNYDGGEVLLFYWENAEGRERTLVATHAVCTGEH